MALCVPVVSQWREPEHLLRPVDQAGEAARHRSGQEEMELLAAPVLENEEDNVPLHLEGDVLDHDRLDVSSVGHQTQSCPATDTPVMASAPSPSAMIRASPCCGLTHNASVHGLPNRTHSTVKDGPTEHGS